MTNRLDQFKKALVPFFPNDETSEYQLYLSAADTMARVMLASNIEAGLQACRLWRGEAA
jgi:hypothetical protein